MRLGVEHDVHIVKSPRKPRWFGVCLSCDWEGPSRESEWEASGDLAEHVENHAAGR